MAVRYAVASGNWSNTATWNGGTLPTSADDVYANGFTVTIDQNVTVLSIQTTAQSPAVAGGGFIVLASFIISATGTGIIPGTTTCITFSGGSGVTATINGIVRNSPTTGSTTAVLKSGVGTLNINGNLNSFGGSRNLLDVSAGGIVNIVGNLNPAFSAPCIRILSGALNPVINIVGDINLNKSMGTSETAITVAVQSTINVTGNLYGGSTSGSCINLAATTSSVYVTGNIYGGESNGGGITTSGASYINVVGTLFAQHTGGRSAPAVISSNGGAINLFTGPFICADTGTFPFSVSRMHYIITSGSYFEFRDSSTNGALPPSTPAPATRLVSPDTAVDAPAASNVRFGVTYALGTQTGTLRVPSPNSVAFGVLTDNTTGTAVLTPQAVWDYATSSLTTAGSIGERLKNASTVDTTGDQLAALL